MSDRGRKLRRAAFLEALGDAFYEVTVYDPRSHTMETIPVPLGRLRGVTEAIIDSGLQVFWTELVEDE